MKLFRSRRKDRRLPENAQRRAQFEDEHAVTAPGLREATATRVRRAVNRADELAQIASVVTIRTRPRNSNS